MNDRIHSALDGELPREGLPPQEREQLAALEGAIRDSVRALHEAPPPDLVDRVMSSLPATGLAPLPSGFGDRLARAARWLWSPRPFSLVWRPLYLPAAAALALTLLAWPESPPAAPPTAGDPFGAAPAAHLYVQFRLEAPGASRVELAGSFTGWEPAVELVEAGPGVWSALVPLEPGVHDYTFVIDGERWVVDPYAPRVGDGFGGSNNRLFLTNPGGNV